MAGEFNPYQAWLGVSPADLPLDYYRLLGLPQFEADSGRIEQAANKQTELLQQHVTGPNAKSAEKLIGEVAAARSVLLAADKRGLYDTKLRAKQAAAKPTKAEPVTSPGASATRKAMPVAKPLPVAAARVTSATPVLPPPPPPPDFNPPSFVVSPQNGMQRGTQKNAHSKTHKGGKSLMIVAFAGVAGIVVALVAVVLFFANNNPSNKGQKLAQASSTGSGNSQPTKPVETPTTKSVPKPEPVKPATVTPPVATPVVDPAKISTTDPAPANPQATNPPTETKPTTPEVAPPLPPTRPTEAADPVDTRLPIPNDTDRAAAEKEIRDVFADSLGAAKNAEEKLAVAKELIQQGNDRNNSPAVRYAAWQLARKLTLEAGQLDEGLALIDATGKIFAVPIVAEKVAVLTESAEAAGAASRTKALTAARREFQSLVQAEAYADAVEMGRAALQFAKAARDKAAVDQITAAAIDLKTRQQQHTEYLTAVEQLKTNSGDAPANLVAGRWLWFTKNDLAEGLQHLSLASDPELAAAATADLAEPTDHKQRVTLADQWRALAEKETDQARETLLKRAKHWYQVALPNAGGLEKVRLEKALAEINRERPSPSGNPAQVASTDSPSALPVKPLPPAVDERPVLAEWRIPKANANTAFKSFLGVYMYQEDRQKIYPVVNLKVPDRNLWTKEVQDKCRGRISFDEISYQGSASFVIPADGVYVLTMVDGKASINGKPTGGGGELSMIKGIHVFSYSVGSHGQPHINLANISLRHKETGAEVTFFNSWRDIQSFLATPIAGQRVMDVSDWKPTEADEVRVDTKTLQVTNPNRPK